MRSRRRKRRRRRRSRFDIGGVLVLKKIPCLEEQRAQGHQRHAAEYPHPDGHLRALLAQPAAAFQAAVKHVLAHAAPGV